MSASRTSAFIRNATNGNTFHNNLATMAKKASTDVVDQLVNRKRQRQDDEHLTTYLMTSMEDFSTDMGDMGEFVESLSVGPCSGPEEEAAMDAMFDFSDVPSSPMTSTSSSCNSYTSFPSSSSSSTSSSSSAFSLPSNFGNLIQATSPTITGAMSPLDCFGSSSASNPSTAAASSHSSSSSSSAQSGGIKSEPRTVFTDSKPPELRLPPPNKAALGNVSPTVADEEEEKAYQARLAAATTSGDMKAVRDIKNSREKVRRAKMCHKFQELHDVVNLTNQMMSLSATGVASPLSAAVAALAAEKAGTADGASSSSKKKDKKRNNKKRPQFKKAQVLNSAIEAIKEMHLQLEALTQQNATLKQQAALSAAAGASL